MKPATLVAAALCVASVAAFAPKASGAALMSARSQRVAPPAMSMEVWSEKNIRLTLPLGVALPLAGLVTPPTRLARRCSPSRSPRCGSSSSSTCSRPPCRRTSSTSRCSSLDCVVLAGFSASRGPPQRASGPRGVNTLVPSRVPRPSLGRSSVDDAAAAALRRPVEHGPLQATPPAACAVQPVHRHLCDREALQSSARGVVHLR